MKITVTEDNGREKIIGTLEDKVFKKTVKESKHLMRLLNAWGVDAQIFTDVLMSDQCHVIMVKDIETKINYMTLPSIVKKHGVFKHYKPHRAQIFLPRRYWAQSGDILSAERIKEILDV